MIHIAQTIIQEIMSERLNHKEEILSTRCSTALSETLEATSTIHHSMITDSKPNSSMMNMIPTIQTEESKLPENQELLKQELLKKTTNKYCYEPKENLQRSAYVPNENQENIDPRFSQNEPKQTPKFYKSSFQSNTVNNNGNKTTITKKHYRDNDNSDTDITEIKEDRDGNRNVRKISP